MPLIGSRWTTVPIVSEVTPSTVVISTERLLLRHLQEQDDEALYGVFGDPEVMQYGDGIQSREWVRNWLQKSMTQYRQRRFGPYVVVEKNSGNVIGYCGLFYFPNINGKPEVEIGYRLVRSAWGKGYATEAARAVCEHAFKNLGISRLIALIDPSNVASLRVAEKIGMHYDQDVMLKGYSHPDRVYCMTHP